MAMHLSLFLFAVFSLNLVLCFGLGIKELAGGKRAAALPLYPWLIVFLQSFALWIFFERFLLFISPWFPDILLVYPLVLFAGQGLEICFLRFFPPSNAPLFKVDSGWTIFSLASLLLTRQFAAGFGEALLLSLAFSGGGLFACLLVTEIRRRSLWESLPRRLRGAPALMIAMGLLSLIFTSSALFILKALLG